MDTPESDEDDDLEFERFSAALDQRKLEREERYVEQKTLVFTRLRELGIEKVFIPFNGSGDDGQIEYIKVKITGERMVKKLVRLPEDHTSPFDSIEHLTYSYLSTKHSGWELESGSFGRIVLDTASGEIREEFTRRLDYEDEEDYDEDDH